jgi:hypothetical protein
LKAIVVGFLSVFFIKLKYEKQYSLFEENMDGFTICKINALNVSHNVPYVLALNLSVHFTTAPLFRFLNPRQLLSLTCVGFRPDSTSAKFNSRQNSGPKVQGPGVE